MLVLYLIVAAVCLQAPPDAAALRMPRAQDASTRAEARLVRKEAASRAGARQFRPPRRYKKAAMTILRAAARAKWPGVNLLSFREAMIWDQALKQAKMSVKNISIFGRSVGKIPASWVEQVKNMSFTKKYRYNFQGSALTKDVAKWRVWVQNFARWHFGPEDYLRYTDISPSYVKVGPYDYSKTSGGFRPKDAGKTLKPSARGEMSPAYYQVMAKSQFTLCPRGDRAFSYRFYEAALTRSIPVVSDIEVDLPATIAVNKTTSMAQALRCIGYHYYDLNKDRLPLEFREDWAEMNQRLVIKYQTFVEGDLTPPGCKGRHFPKP